MSNVVDNFWNGFSSELDKVGALKFRNPAAAMNRKMRVDLPSPIKPTPVPKPKPLPGSAIKQPGQVKPKPPKPSTPASAGPAPNTAVSQPNPPPAAPKAKGASPTAKPVPWYSPKPVLESLKGAASMAGQTAPFMFMNKMENRKPKQSNVYV